MMRLGELSRVVGGQLTGQPDLEIGSAASISRAGITDITFVSSPKYFEAFLQSDAAAAVIGFSPDCDEKPCIVVDDVTEAFIEIVLLFKPAINRSSLGISPQAIVSPTARISDDVCIHPGAVIMDNVEIGTTRGDSGGFPPLPPALSQILGRTHLPVMNRLNESGVLSLCPI